MILADASIWRAVLAANIPGLPQLFMDLWNQESVTSPPAVFAEVLTECDDELGVRKLRAWAMEAPPLHCGALAWVSAGDVGRVLVEGRVDVNGVDHLLVALALREDAMIWSLNPAYDRVCEVLPVRRFVPQGFKRGA